MTDVSVIVSSLESGSLPLHSGLSALLLKSRDDPEEVYTSLPYVVQKLASENDHQVISTILNIFCELLGPTDNDSIGNATAEVLIKSNVLGVIFHLLPEKEFAVRFPLLRCLLYACQRNPKDVQTAAVASGIAIGQLTSILQDNREILRNEAVLLFSELCEDNQDLPVLFAFESGFELLIHIMEAEGWSEGGVVVQDCLRLMWLVLNENTNTQSFFKEMGFMHKLLPLFQAPERWGNRRAAISEAVVSLLSVFVSPTLPANHVMNMVSTMEQIGLMPHVLHLVRSPHCPDEVVKACLTHLAWTCTQSSAQSIIDSGVCLAALTLTVNSERSMSLRTAGWELARSCVQKSTTTQRELVFGISQATSGDSSQPKTFGALMGRHILVALMGGDSNCCWFSSTILARCLTDPSVKDWLLTVKLPYQDEDGKVKESVTLFTILNSRILQRPVRLAILLLLAAWTHGSPNAIAQLLSNSPDCPESNSLTVLLNILSSSSGNDDLVNLAERSLASYILLLAVLQLPAVRGQLIPVLQQLGGRFVEPLRAATIKSSLYPDSSHSTKLLEDDFKKLVRDALPAAEEIMKIQLKPKTPPPPPSSSSDVNMKTTPSSSSPTSSPTPPPKSPIPTLNVEPPEDDNREQIEQQILDMSNELICLRERISELEDDLEDKTKDNINYSRQIDDLEIKLENANSTTPNGDLSEGQTNETSNDDLVRELENELKSHSLKANHSKLALANLEKSIQSYHDKINMLEAQNVEISANLDSSEEQNEKTKNDLVEKTLRCERAEEEVNKLISTTSSDFYQNSAKIQQLESERDILLDENTTKFEHNRILQDRILKLETLLKQQNEFIDKHEAESENAKDIRSKVFQLEQTLCDMEARHKRELLYKDDAISELERQVDRKETSMKESKAMINDLKESLSETKETIHDHVTVIGSQRAEIDTLRVLIDQNGIEMPPKKTERVRQSSAESSTPTVVESGDLGDISKDIDLAHLAKPIHADVLLRIESTNSESSRSSKPDQRPPPSIEVTGNVEILPQSKSEEESNDEFFESPRSSHYDHLRRMMPSAVSSGADISANEGYDNDADVTETKRRKSKIELDRIRQHGEKQKIKEKSNERDQPKDEPEKAKTQQKPTNSSKKSKPGPRSKETQKKPKKTTASKPPRSKRK